MGHRKTSAIRKYPPVESLSQRPWSLKQSEDFADKFQPTTWNLSYLHTPTIVLSADRF
jgi:hypothetical protein